MVTMIVASILVLLFGAYAYKNKDKAKQAAQILADAAVQAKDKIQSQDEQPKQ